MKGSTGKSRVVLDSEQRRRTDPMRYKRWTPQRIRSKGSYLQARILSTAVHLELFDWLGKKAKGSRAATSHFGGTQEVWEVFLDALSAMGLLQKRSVRYKNTPFTLNYLC